MNDPNDANPYAPPVPVDEEIRFDLRKIAKNHNRIVFFIHLWLFLLGFELLNMCGIIFFLKYSDDPDIPLFPWIAIAIVHFTLIVFSYYGTFLVTIAAWAMKYRFYTVLLLLIGTAAPLLNIVICLLLNRRARAILRDAGMETAGRKIDLAQFRREEDY